MTFQPHRISYHHENTPPKQKKKNKSRLPRIILIFIIVYLFFKVIPGILNGIPLTQLIFSFGKDLAVDANGNTNFLLLGTGGGTHEGPDLTDTIIIVSLNQKKNLVTLLSIPRDLYVENKYLGGARINDMYALGKHKFGSSEEGIEILKDTVEKVVDTDIQYYIKINFDGFRQIVDSLDGVKVYVDETINDPLYPKDGTLLYEPFHLEKGLQQFNGEIALKYVRSRQTTSDFDRSKRQQKLIFALKDKAMTKEILTNPSKLKDLYFSVSENIETNLSIREIIKAAEISKKITEKSLISHVLHDDPSKCGGFLYTPDRNLYGGAFVLIPAGDSYNDIHRFAKILFEYPELLDQDAKIHVLNASGANSLATRTLVILERNCFNVIRYGNGRNFDVSETTYFIKNPGKKEVIKALQQIFKGNISEKVPNEYLSDVYKSEADIILELGKNHIVVDPFDLVVQLKKTEDNGEQSEPSSINKKEIKAGTTIEGKITTETSASLSTASTQ